MFRRTPLVTYSSTSIISRLFTRSYTMTSIDSAAVKAAEDFIDFVNDSPTPYHAVHSASQRLLKAGFKQIKERDSWASVVRPGGKYYLTRNGSSIVAFAVGDKWKPGNPVAMVGTHTDSCCLRLKPVSKKSGAGFMQVGVETYGGGIWHTWFDRDLSFAGRVMVKDGKGGFVAKLIKNERPILRIPTLAIHLDRTPEFKPNKETELFPIAGLVAAELDRTGATEKGEKTEETDNTPQDFYPLKSMPDRHHPYILEIIAEHAEVDVASIVDFEVILYDVQKSTIGGINNELIYSARLDNLEMTYCAVEGLIESVSSASALDEDSTIRLVACFDHEEVGSTSAQGARSNLLPSVIKRLSVIPAAHDSTSDDSYDKISESELDISTAFEETLAKSFLVSADMAHSVNPNYAGKYEGDHRPEMNKGTVLKINANQSYTTNSPGSVLLQEVARKAKPSKDSTASVGVPLQLFVVRNDSPCGGTIGPMLSAALGTRTIDLGNAQLSMHSIRETSGVLDVSYAVRLFESFFEHYSDLETKIFID